MQRQQHVFCTASSWSWTQEIVNWALILMFWWLKQKFETRDILHLIVKNSSYFNFDSIKRTAAYWNAFVSMVLQVKPTTFSLSSFNYYQSLQFSYFKSFRKCLNVRVIPTKIESKVSHSTFTASIQRENQSRTNKWKL